MLLETLHRCLVTRTSRSGVCDWRTGATVMGLIVGKSFASCRATEAFVTASIEYCILLCRHTHARAQGAVSLRCQVSEGAREMTAAVSHTCPVHRNTSPKSTSSRFLVSLEAVVETFSVKARFDAGIGGNLCRHVPFTSATACSVRPLNKVVTWAPAVVLPQTSA